MKETHYFTCEICGRNFSAACDALECEAQPKPAGFPKGMIYGDHRRGSFYGDMTFAVMECHMDGYALHTSNWACRSTPVGDTLGKERCGGGYSVSIGDRHLNQNNETFKRMVVELNKAGIVPTVWDGTKAVPLADWLKSKRKPIRPQPR